jgi:hypothetical protein
MLKAGCEVLTEVVMKSSTFWDTMSRFLLGSFFDSEDGGDMFFRNVY